MCWSLSTDRIGQHITIVSKHGSRRNVIAIFLKKVGQQSKMLLETRQLLRSDGKTDGKTTSFFTARL